MRVYRSSERFERMTQSPHRAPSRIGCIAFSQSKWYLSTPSKEPFSNQPHHKLHSFILPSIAKYVLILIYLRVDFYVRHANLWGRFLREATGGLLFCHEECFDGTWSGL
jgi:hypothetical protein